MLGPHCNGTLMYASESEIIRNDAFLSKLEQKLITLSDKYGLGDILFIERNPETTILLMLSSYKRQKNGLIKEYLMYGTRSLMKWMNLLRKNVLNA